MDTGATACIYIHQYLKRHIQRLHDQLTPFSLKPHALALERIVKVASPNNLHGFMSGLRLLCHGCGVMRMLICLRPILLALVNVQTSQVIQQLLQRHLRRTYSSLCHQLHVYCEMVLCSHAQPLSHEEFCLCKRRFIF